MTNPVSMNYSANNYSYPNAYDYQAVAEYPIDIKEHPDCYEYVYERPASTGKKVGVGVASFALPGLGQAINGQWGKGLGFFAATFVAIPIIMVAIMAKNMPKNLSLGSVIEFFNTPEMKKFQILTIGTNWIMRGLATFDAVKNAKKKETVIVPKQQQMFNYNA